MTEPRAEARLLHLVSAAGSCTHTHVNIHTHTYTYIHTLASSALLKVAYLPCVRRCAILIHIHTYTRFQRLAECGVSALCAALRVNVYIHTYTCLHAYTHMLPAPCRRWGVCPVRGVARERVPYKLESAWLLLGQVNICLYMYLYMCIYLDIYLHIQLQE